MGYTTGIPAAVDLISNSQSTIKDNFDSLNTQFAGNHNALTSVAANGHHTFITFDNSPAAPVSAGTVSNMYPSPISGAQEMVWGNAAGSTQITSGGNAIWKGGTGTGVVGKSITANGYLILPNGLYMQWGFKAAPTGTAGQVTFPIAFPTAAPFSIQMTLYNTGIRTWTLDQNTPPTTTTFNYLCSSMNSGIYWFAIGH